MLKGTILPTVATPSGRNLDDGEHVTADMKLFAEDLSKRYCVPDYPTRARAKVPMHYPTRVRPNNISRALSCTRITGVVF